MLKGKIEIQSRISLENVFEEEKGTLGLIYTPGVAYVSKEISNNKELTYDYTSKWNNVAIVCDGTRVLGLGNVGPEASDSCHGRKGGFIQNIRGHQRLSPLYIHPEQRRDNSIY